MYIVVAVRDISNTAHIQKRSSLATPPSHHNSSNDYDTQELTLIFWQVWRDIPGSQIYHATLRQHFTSAMSLV